MVVLLKMLSALVLSGACVTVAYLSSGWVGLQITLWGSAVLVPFGVVYGIGHTVIEGIVVAGLYTVVGYFILKMMPQILPIYCGVLVSTSIYGIITGVRTEIEEAPQREAERLATEEQRARDETARHNREAEWQAYRKHIATLPVASPKADIKECLEDFRTYLNQAWPQLPPDLFEPIDYGYELIHTWLQRQFERYVVKPLGCPYASFYGEYDSDYDDELPSMEPVNQQKPQYQPMEIWVNENYDFDCLVSVRDGWHYTEPPFDHVMVQEDMGPDASSRDRYIPFDQARFELRPAWWISES